MAGMNHVLIDPNKLVALLVLAYITVQGTRKTVTGIKIWGEMVVGSVQGAAEGEVEGMKRLTAAADGT